MTNIDLVIINKEYYSYSEALQHMEEQNVNHLGWLNSGLRVPNDCNWSKVYSNWSGTSCLYVDKAKRIAYSVDMGD